MDSKRSASDSDPQPGLDDQRLATLIEEALAVYGSPPGPSAAGQSSHDLAAIRRYYRQSARAYRRIHSENEIVHMRIDGRDFYQADVILGWLPVNGLVLELGCGPGANLAYLQQKVPGGQWAGIDLTPSHIRRAEQRCQPGTQLQVADFNNLPYDSQELALLYAVESLCHSPDYRHTLAEAWRVLAPGGSLIIFDGWPAAEQSAVERRASDLAQAAMAVYHAVPQQSWTDAARELGFIVIRETDYSERIRENTTRFAQQAQRVVASRRLRLAAKLLPAALRANGLAALLIDPLLQRGALQYGLLVLEKPE